MKNRLILLSAMLILLSFSSASAQQKKDILKKFKLTKVSKAVYFDKSMPLREVDPKPHIRPDKLKIKKTNFFKKVKPKETNKPGIVDPVAQTTQGKGDTKFPIQNFDGVPNLFYGAPPDTDGEVGLNHFFQMINVHFAIYDKNGTKLYGPASNAVLWEGFDGPWSKTDGDPIVVYDERADRWIATQFSVNNFNGKYYQLVAVSQTPDPTGSFYRYAFEYDEMNDYPKVSAWTNSYIVTYNMFHLNTPTQGTFLGGAVAAFDREKLLSGNPEAEQQFFELGENYYGILSADIDGTTLPAEGAPCPLINMKRSGSRGINVFEFNVDWENPNNSAVNLVYVLTPEMYSTYVQGDGVPQPNTDVLLDNFMGQALFRLPYRNFGSHESMVFNHAVGVNGVHGIRWYELRKSAAGNWEIYQQSTFAPGDGVHRWMGSIAMNGKGDIAMGYSVSNGTDLYPSIRYVGRTANAPLNQFNMTEVNAFSGLSSQSFANRWGDYSCMSIDPSNDTTFWFTTEYTNSSENWRTRILSFRLGGDASPPMVYAGPDTTICENLPYNTSSATSESVNTYLWESSGSGNFAPNNTSLESNYIRSNADVENGGVWLKLTGTAYDLTTVTDSLYLSFRKKATVDAGANDSICKNEPYQLNPTVANAASYVWSSEGDGMFDNVNLLNATYTPGTNDSINHGQNIKLTLTVTSQAPCDQTKSDNINLFVKDCLIDIPVIANDKNLIIQPNPSNGHFSVIMNGIESHTTQLIVYNSLGEIVKKEDLNTENGKINKKYALENLKPGVYVLHIKQNNRISTKKFIIK